VPPPADWQAASAPLIAASRQSLAMPVGLALAPRHSRRSEDNDFVDMTLSAVCVFFAGL
jgi:hypothetical protein